ncbi:putative repeat protein (TIGR03806 family) [Spirosoma lacussanchae]|uniref:SO2930 family diheme c-type cytochrome n=1 Tax=Spirosoma lacussanchae TaxID=1884249 RepID=UPI001108270B|nr:SO2930 family diheme c-type cytochrome [Spirosoma lacussanchae]
MKGLLLSIGAFLLSVAFTIRQDYPAVAAPESLSAWGFFTGNIADQQPAAGVVPYRLNTPLFSDYAEKLRFVRLPAGQSVPYTPDDVLAFPVGTVLIKTFYFPTDFRQPDKGRRLLETRLLVHEAAGWKALEYVWNAEQTDAILEVAGEQTNVAYTDASGKNHRQLYVMPNLNQCKGCHNRNETLMPIGPSARQLNGNLTYADGEANQLTYWQQHGLLTNLPALASVPKTPVWNDPATGSLDARARAWLDINCAHCHRPDGPASTSGLNLRHTETNPTAWGVQKTPVAAGRGSGGRQFDIVPGKPDESILVYRMESTDPGVMMPEVARKVTHREGVALVREWIRAMHP